MREGLGRRVLVEAERVRKVRGSSVDRPCFGPPNTLDHITGQGGVGWHVLVACNVQQIKVQMREESVVPNTIPARSKAAAIG